MAVLISHQGQLFLDAGIGGAPTDYSAQITKVSYPTLKINSGEHWTFGTRDSNQTVGGKSHRIKITCRVETTATSLYGRLTAIAESNTLATYNGTLSFLLGDPDTTSSGSHTWAGEVKVVEIGATDGDASKGDAQTCDFTLATDGVVTYAVVP